MLVKGSKIVFLHLEGVYNRESRVFSRLSLVIALALIRLIGSTGSIPRLPVDSGRVLNAHIVAPQLPQSFSLGLTRLLQPLDHHLFKHRILLYQLFLSLDFLPFQGDL